MKIKNKSGTRRIFISGEGEIKLDRRNFIWKYSVTNIRSKKNRCFIYKSGVKENGKFLFSFEIDSINLMANQTPKEIEEGMLFEIATKINSQLEK